MQNELKCKLESMRSNANSKYYNISDVCELKKEVLNELDFYAGVIPDFFSYNNEAVRIKNMYKRLKELDYTRNKEITCVDVEKALRIYNEYMFDGMCLFINNYIDSPENSSEDRTTLEKQLDTAIQADPLFIESLFGGKNNESTNMELTEAVKNVELLVDFLDFVKVMREKFARVCDKCGNSIHMIRVLRLMANSMCAFSNRMISNIMDTYEAINNGLDDKFVKPVDNSFKVF